MTRNAAFWTIMTVAAIAGLITMIVAILTAPAYIAVPVAIYLAGVGVFVTAAAGRYVVRNAMQAA